MVVAFLAGMVPLLHAQKVIYVERYNQRDTEKNINILRAEGYDVTVVDTDVDTVQTAADYAAQGYDLLICDEVISSGAVGALWRNSPIPRLRN